MTTHPPTLYRRAIVAGKAHPLIVELDDGVVSIRVGEETYPLHPAAVRERAEMLRIALPEG